MMMRSLRNITKAGAALMAKEEDNTYCLGWYLPSGFNSSKSWRKKKWPPWHMLPNGQTKVNWNETADAKMQHQLCGRWWQWNYCLLELWQLEKAYLSGNGLHRTGFLCCIHFHVPTLHFTFSSAARSKKQQRWRLTCHLLTPHSMIKRTREPNRAGDIPISLKRRVCNTSGNIYARKR